jgi:hypothetical protein
MTRFPQDMVSPEREKVKKKNAQAVSAGFRRDTTMTLRAQLLLVSIAVRLLV